MQWVSASRPVAAVSCGGRSRVSSGSRITSLARSRGSALDVAKVMRLFIKRPALRLAKFNFNDDWSGLVRCICIPTTAGTGSEVGRSSVITLAGTQKKAVLFLPRLLAKLVVLDPDLTR